MYSHVNPKVNDKFKERMNRNYVKQGEVKANIGKVNKHLLSHAGTECAVIYRLY